MLVLQITTCLCINNHCMNSRYNHKCTDQRTLKVNSTRSLIEVLDLILSGIRRKLKLVNTIK